TYVSNNPMTYWDPSGHRGEAVRSYLEGMGHEVRYTKGSGGRPATIEIGDTGVTLVDGVDFMQYKTYDSKGNEIWTAYFIGDPPLLDNGGKVGGGTVVTGNDPVNSDGGSKGVGSGTKGGGSGSKGQSYDGVGGVTYTRDIWDGVSSGSATAAKKPTVEVPNTDSDYFKEIGYVGKDKSAVSYVFYDPNIFGGATGRKFALAYAQELGELNDQSVYIIAISSKTAFASAWQDMGNESGETMDINTVIMHFHGSSTSMSFKTKDDRFSGSIDVDEIKALEKKKIDTIIILNCLAGNKGADTNVATAFMKDRQPYITRVIASDVYVGVGAKPAWYRFGDESSDEGWHITKIKADGYHNKDYPIYKEGDYMGFKLYEWNSNDGRNTVPIALGTAFNNLSDLINTAEGKGSAR
ncbi:hypothetical protein LJC32_03135, partial [Oscillospiraceae bacterium OttesenSCG-928-F05]|nr:hypothetical protein [Oscillospiraceae bacterium OttesenSCG-928-F05]